jgi:hypothetical protein
MVNEQHVNVVNTDKGFTEAFEDREIDLLVRLGLIEHDYEGYVLRQRTSSGDQGVGPVHRFYKKA